MAQQDRIQKITGADADAAFERRLDRLLEPQDIRTRLDAEKLLDKCEGQFDAEVRGNRAENFITEGLELVGAGTAGALATWRTTGGFPIGQWANFVLGFGAKAACFGLEAKLPKFEDMCESPTTGRRVLRTIARTGKVLLHSQLSMMTRDTIEDDQ